MECKIKNRHKLIFDYLMEELPEDEARAFEEHYFQCETCFKELKISEDAVKLIAKDGKAIFEPEAHQPLAETEGKSYENKESRNIIHKLIFPGLSLPKRWEIAFAAVAVIVLVLFLTFRNDREVLNEKVISKGEETFPEGQNDSLTKDTKTEKDNSQIKNDVAELTGPSFKPVPYLEEWISENVRSQNDVIDKIFSPVIGEKFYDSKITFQWKMNKASTGIIIKIMNNLEKEIYSSTLGNSQTSEYKVQTDSEIFKQSGLYYWRIEDENEVLFVGKFYFLKRLSQKP